jgi:hypothetical protein
MATRHWIELFLGLSLSAVVLVVQPASAEEASPWGAAFPQTGATSAAPPDKSFLDALARDLGLSLSRPGDANLTVPLAPRQWTFSGLRPYAALSPRMLRPVGDGLIGLATPDRESEADLSHSLGIGAGVTWRLSDRLDLFGQYMFRTNPGTGIPAGNPTLRPDLESPGLKGGFSIRF